MIFDLSTLLVVASVASLAFAAIGILALRLNNRPISTMWVTSFFGLLLAWLFILISRMNIPHQVRLINWKFDDSLSFSVVLLLDSISWAYAAALASLGLSVILTAVSRLPGINWRAWIGVLALDAIGLVSILAGNPLTFLLSWSALDLVEILTWQIQLKDSAVRKRVVISFFGRVLGSTILIAAILAARFMGQRLSFDDISPIIAPMLIFAVGLRLGVVPLQRPFLAENALRQGVGTMLRFTPAASALTLLTRVAAVEIDQTWVYVFLPLTLVAIFYSALTWINVPDELSGRPYWVILITSLAVVAAILHQPAASLAWGMACVFSGGLIFLSSFRTQSLLPIFVLGALGISMFPFTPVWSGTTVYSALWQSLPVWVALIGTVILLVSQSMLLLGYLIHAVQVNPEISTPERWVWFVYPTGLAILVFGQFAIGWISQPDFRNLSPIDWAASISVVVIASLIGFIRMQKPDFYLKFSSERNLGGSVWYKILSMRWAYTGGRKIFELFGRLLTLFNTTLEGKGGLLWALVWLVMLFTIVLQFSPAP